MDTFREDDQISQLMLDEFLTFDSIDDGSTTMEMPLQERSPMHTFNTSQQPNDGILFMGEKDAMFTDSADINNVDFPLDADAIVAFLGGQSMMTQAAQNTCLPSPEFTPQHSRMGSMSPIGSDVSQTSMKRKSDFDMLCNSSSGGRNGSVVEVESSECGENYSINQPSKNVAHNAVERRYRNNLNDSIQDLKKILPAYRPATSTTFRNSELDGPIPEDTPKDNKASILKHATDYIFHLQCVVQRYQRDTKDLLDIIENSSGQDQLKQLSAKRSSQPYVYWQPPNEQMPQDSASSTDSAVMNNTSVTSGTASALTRRPHQSRVRCNQKQIPMMKSSEKSGTMFMPAKSLAILLATVCAMYPAAISFGSENSSEDGTDSFVGRSLSGISTGSSNAWLPLVCDTIVTFLVVYVLAKFVVTYLVLKPYDRVFKSQESTLFTSLVQLLKIPLQKTEASSQQIGSVATNLERIADESVVQKYFARVGQQLSVLQAHRNGLDSTLVAAVFPSSATRPLCPTERLFSSMGFEISDRVDVNWHLFLSTSVQAYINFIESNMDKSLQLCSQATSYLSCAIDNVEMGVGVGKTPVVLYLLSFLACGMIVEVRIVCASKMTAESKCDNARFISLVDSLKTDIQRLRTLAEGASRPTDELDISCLLKNRLCLYEAMSRTLSRAEPTFTRLLFRKALSHQ